jgi:predicted outer membrane repeat protein
MKGRIVKRRTPTTLLTALATAALVSVGLIATASPASAATVSNEQELRTAWADASASEITLAADITLTDCDSSTPVRNSSVALSVLGNGHTISQSCAGAGVLIQQGTGALSFDRVTITGGQAPVTGGGIAGHDVTLTNSTITHNEAESGGGIFAEGTVTLTNTTVTDNDASSGGGLLATGLVTLTNSTVTHNSAVLGGGIAVSKGDATVTTSTISDNTAGSGGGGGIFVAGGITLDRSTVSGNTAGSGGGGGVLGQSGVTVIASTVDHNTAGAGGGGGVLAQGDVTIRNATVAGNTATSGGAGGGVAGNHVTLVYATVVRNDAITGAALDIQSATSLASFGSVVALSVGATNCHFAAGPATLSYGNNFSDDASCGFDALTDRQNAGDPQLGALADNGGPTQTIMPQPTSRLIDAIANFSCRADGASAITTDQRGISRPQDERCDIGSVEVVPSLTDLNPTSPVPPAAGGSGAIPLTLVPRFTG